MRITTRLLLPLLVTVAAVMLIFALYSLRQRETALTDEAQRETNAYATALGLALESALRAGSREDVQEAIDRISDEPTIYGVIVYGADTRVLFTSQPVGAIETAPLGAVRRVIADREPSSFTREIEGQLVYSIVRPLLAPGGEVLGAMEVAQPLSFVEQEKANTRKRFLLNTVVLFVALTTVIALLTRRLIAEPLNRFVHAVRALGRGELGYRVERAGGGAELTELAREFNGMAGRLEQARAEIERESEQRYLLARRLRETEKLAVVGNLAAGLAHEIAAPLHVIRGRAEMMRRRTTDAVAERNLRIITDQIDRITAIVRHLLDYARRREPRSEQLDAGELLQRVAEFLGPELERANVSLEIDCPNSTPLIGDPDLLHQVLLNLVMNSIQVMTDRPDPRSIVMRCGAGDNGDTVQIEVQDTGPGLAPHVLARAFEPFFTTKAPGEGTGLGLAVAHSIVEEHGGTIEVLNVAAGGALFRIRLPAQRRASAAAHA